MSFDKQLSADTKKAIKAKTRLVKENKLFNLFGGRVIDVKWTGRDIAT